MKECIICGKNIIKGRNESKKYFSKKLYCGFDCMGKAKHNRKNVLCDNCGKLFTEKVSSYIRKNKHFCCMNCYSKYRKHTLSFTEQNSYKGIRKDKDSSQIYHKRYVENNREYVNDLKLRHYARKKGAEGTHTYQEREELKKRYSYKCVGCGCDKKLTKDHIIPLSKGGTNYINNIQPLCRNCNSRKHNKLDYIYENPELLSTTPTDAK